MGFIPTRSSEGNMRCVQGVHTKINSMAARQVTGSSLIQGHTQTISRNRDAGRWYYKKKRQLCVKCMYVAHLHMRMCMVKYS